MRSVLVEAVVKPSFNHMFYEYICNIISYNMHINVMYITIPKQL